MAPPAARIGDMHTCPMVNPGPVPHVGGPILPPCAVTVITGGMPQARVGDMAVCVGPLDVIAKGSATVIVSGMPAARLGDSTAHGGVIVVGFPTVLIGDAGGGGGGKRAAGAGLEGGGSFVQPTVQAKALIAAAKDGTPFCERCNAQSPAGMGDALKSLWNKLTGTTSRTTVTPVTRGGEAGDDFKKIVKEVNPKGGNINCGNIIDANFKRITGADPGAIAPTAQDGTWKEIEERYDTKLNKGQSFADAFDAVSKGGDGTIAIVKVLYSDPTVSHVVTMANDRGSVGILEGQGGGSYVTSADIANAMYNSDGGTVVRYGIVPSGTKLP